MASEAFRPPSMSIIGDLAAPSQRKAAFALSRLAINLGMSIGPVVGGFLAMYSFRLLFYADGSTSILAGILVAVLPWRTLQTGQLSRTSIDGSASDPDFFSQPRTDSHLEVFKCLERPALYLFSDRNASD